MNEININNNNNYSAQNEIIEWLKTTIIQYIYSELNNNNIIFLYKRASNKAKNKFLLFLLFKF